MDGIGGIVIMYKKHLDINGQVSDKSVVRIADNAFIPFDPANSDYQQYLAWVEDGNVAQEWQPE